MTNRDFFIRCWEDEYPVFLKTFRAVHADRGTTGRTPTRARRPIWCGCRSSKNVAGSSFWKPGKSTGRYRQSP